MGVSAAPTAAMKQFLETENKGHRGCSHCPLNQDAEQREFPACGGCKLIWYCSKECQRADWKGHKPMCLANQATRKYLATMAGLPGLSGSQGAGSLTGDALLEATQRWMEARRSVLDDMAANTADIFPLAEGFNLPKKIAIITLEADNAPATNKLKIDSVETYTIPTFLSMSPSFGGFLETYTAQAKATAGCPGLALLGIRCGLALRIVPLFLKPNDRKIRGPYTAAAAGGRPMPWKEILNVLPFSD